MTGHVLRFESGVHRLVDALLPWYVNGTLTPEELEYVGKHLSGCEQCRQEAEWLRELHAACVRAESASGGSGALRKLRRQLEARRPDRVWAHNGSWARWSLAASFVVLAAFAVSVMRDSAVAPYRTLASPSSVAGTGSLIVVFDPATTEAQLRRMLRDTGARLIDGPTQANAYVLDVPSARLDAATRALRSEHSVILVERLSQGGNP